MLRWHRLPRVTLRELHDYTIRVLPVAILIKAAVGMYLFSAPEIFIEETIYNENTGEFSS